MRVGNVVRIVGREEGLGRLVGMAARVVAHSPKGSQPSFWLVELNEPTPTAAKRLGGWSGVAIDGSRLHVIG